MCEGLSICLAVEFRIEIYLLGEEGSVDMLLKCVARVSFIFLIRDLVSYGVVWRNLKGLVLLRRTRAKCIVVGLYCFPSYS